MKNEKIHDSLPEKDVRDFLSKNLVFYVPPVEHLKDEIEKLKGQMEIAKKNESCISLMESKGWSFFDVSDEIEDYDRDSYFNFIGTEQEFIDSGLCPEDKNNPANDVDILLEILRSFDRRSKEDMDNFTHTGFLTPWLEFMFENGFAFKDSRRFQTPSKIIASICRNDNPEKAKVFLLEAVDSGFTKLARSMGHII